MCLWQSFADTLTKEAEQQKVEYTAVSASEYDPEDCLTSDVSGYSSQTVQFVNRISVGRNRKNHLFLTGERFVPALGSCNWKVLQEGDQSCFYPP